MKKTIVLALLTLLATAQADAISRKNLATYASSLNGKKKAELKTAVYKIINSPKVLSYGSGTNATWYGFYQTDRITETNECINRYSATKFYFGSSNTGTAISGMNIEHSFPKSWWGGSTNTAYKDLYNLYPSDSKANTSKSNYPMGVVTTVKTEEPGYDKVGTGTIDGVSGVQCWEPGDAWKGDFSRSYMYMATAYQNLTWTGTQGLQELENDTWPTLKPWAYTLYLEWIKGDPVDELEVTRNNAVAAIQGNRNLFVDYPYLAEYVWGDSADVAFNPSTAITTCDDDNRYGHETTMKVNRPTFSPAGGTYSGTQTVTISCSTPNTTIYYTTDGSEPKYSGAVYTGPISVSENMTIRAIAKDSEGNYSYENSATYVISAIADGVFTKVTSADQLVVGNEYIFVAEATNKYMNSTAKTSYFESSDATIVDNTIAYSDDMLVLTLGGSEGSWTFMNGDKYLVSTAAKSVSLSTTMATWEISTSDFTATAGNSSYGTLQYNKQSPRFTTYSSSQTAAVLYYRTSGSTPETVDAPILLINGAETTGGEVAVGTIVKFLAPDADHVIYTTDGTTPSASNGTTGWTCTISKDMTIKAVAVSASGALSKVVSATFTVKEVSTVAEDATFIFNTDEGLSELGITKPAADSQTGTSVTDVELVSGGVTLTCTKGTTDARVWNSSGATDLRIYKNGSLTFSSENPIVKIVFTSANNSIGNLSVDNAAVVDNTWTGEADKVTFTATGTVRINTITVTYKTVSTTLLGDVNRDGEVTAADVTALVDIILGKDATTPYTYDHEAADVNQDGQLSVADVTALVNIILAQ